MIRCLIIVEGRVQGVGFRYFAQSNAIKYALTGFARNLNNGMVEIQVQGLEENIAKFLSMKKEGIRFIRVDDYSLKKISLIEDENKFKVSY